MNHQQNKTVNEIVSAIRPELERAGITASLEERWLTLSTPFASGWVHGMAIPRCAWEMLERNGLTAGSAKLVITPPATTTNPTVQAVAEILIDSPDTLSARIDQAIADLAIATSADVGGNEESRSPASDLKELTTAAGWDFHCRGDGRLTIALDVPGSSANAILASDGAAIHAAVELAVANTESDEIRQAAGLFMLQLGGIARLVRPALCTRGDERETLQLQSLLGKTPTPVELNHALSALSVACRMGQREVALLLSSESISQRYLSLRGWSAEAMTETVASV